MPTVQAKYLGDLRVECTHVASGTKIITDAPVDNNGKGEAFSPTDLCSTSLGACAMTIMGIFCRQNNIDISGASMEITKTMGKDPRRIAKIQVIFHMPPKSYPQDQKKLIEEAALNCPVCLSLGANVEREIIFDWPQ